MYIQNTVGEDCKNDLNDIQIILVLFYLDYLINKFFLIKNQTKYRIAKYVCFE